MGRAPDVRPEYGDRRRHAGPGLDGTTSASERVADPMWRDHAVLGRAPRRATSYGVGLDGVVSAGQEDMTPPHPLRRGPRTPRLAAALVGSTLLPGCAAPESPFEMWDMRVGMPMAELDSISFHDQSARFTCMRAPGGHRRCSVPLRGSPGRMDALVDSTDRVVELMFATGVDRQQGDLTMLVGLVEATQELVEAWDQVVEPVTTGTPLEGETDTWRAGEGRWSARIDWWATYQPLTVTVTDEQAMSAFHAVEATAALESQVRGASNDGDVEDGSAQVELRRLVVAQRAYRARTGTYASDLGALHFIPDSGVVVQIGGTRSAGWWAEARTDEGRACVVWEGVPPPPEQGRVLGGAPGEPDCG